MEYHPMALKLLYEFKTSSSSEIPTLLLPFFLEGSKKIDLEKIYEILYSYKNIKSKEDGILRIKEAINKSMIWKLYTFSSKIIQTGVTANPFDEKLIDEENKIQNKENENNCNKRFSKKIILKSIDIKETFHNKKHIWVLTRRDGLYTEDINKEMDRIKFKNINKKSKNARKIKIKRFKITNNDGISNIEKVNDGKLNNDRLSNDQLSSISSSQNENFKRTKKSQKTVNKNTNSSLLQFCKVLEKGPKIELKDYFNPIKFDDSTVVFDEDKEYDDDFTIRKRNDLINPVKNTYIKFHDRIKPPFFGTITKIDTKNSLERLNVVDDYEYDSDLEWEYDDADSLGSTDDSETEDDDYEAEFIDGDDEEIPFRDYRIPVPFKPKLKLEIFNKNINLDLPLEKKEQISNEEIEILKSLLSNSKVSIKNFVKSFSDDYHIKPTVIFNVINNFQENNIKDINV